MNFVVAVGGATGMPYAKGLLDHLAGPGREQGIETDLVFTKTGRICWRHEIGTDPREHYDFPLWAPGDFTAPFASGSARYDGMVVLPCSAGNLARIANGLSTDLMSRAADVMLKERRKLVLLLRESPYNLILLRNMVAVSEAGAVVMPASPSFYNHPGDFGDLVTGVVSRVLDQLGIDNDIAPRWTGREE